MPTLTLRNQTKFLAQCVIMKDDQLFVRIPALETGSTITIPNDNVMTVIATAVIDGNTHTSAPQSVCRSMGFVAQVPTIHSQGNYGFEIQQIRNDVPNTLTFQKTCPSAVTFSISKNGAPLQNVVLEQDFQVQSLDISDTFAVHAVVNGVTTATVQFTRSQATITVSTDDAALGSGVACLLVD